MNFYVRLIVMCMSFFGTSASAATKTCQALSTQSTPLSYVRDVSLLRTVAQTLKQMNLPVHESLQTFADDLEFHFGPEFRVFALHPGISSRPTYFIEFVTARRKTEPLETLDEIFEAFRVNLGSTQLQRAVALTAHELKDVQTYGLIPNRMRQDVTSVQALLEVARVGVQEAVRLHLSSKTVASSPMASFTENPTMARWVVSPKTEQGKLRYMFIVEIDWLDAVYLDFDSGSRTLTEAIIFGAISPEKIVNRASVEGETESYDFQDAMNSLREFKKNDRSVDDNQIPITKER